MQNSSSMLGSSPRASSARMLVIIYLHRTPPASGHPAGSPGVHAVHEGSGEGGSEAAGFGDFGYGLSISPTSSVPVKRANSAYIL